MIPAGRKYVTPQQAAEKLHLKLTAFQNRKVWETFPIQVKSFARAGAARPLRLWDEEQFDAYAAQMQLPEEERDFTTIPSLPVDPQNPRKKDLRDEDLLDWIEAWESMPEDDRPTQNSWASYIKARATTGPAADVVIEGTRYWYRRTIRDWNANRPKGHGAARTGGNYAGRVESVARVREDAVDRVRRTAELLAAADPAAPAAKIAQQLVEEFGFTKRHGERLVADTQHALGLRERVPALLQEHWDQPRERVVKLVAESLELPSAIAAYLVDDVQAQRKPRAKKK